MADLINYMEKIDDLYFDKEMSRKKSTWELTIGDVSLAKGLILDDELQFSITNQYGTGSGDIISNTLKSFQTTAKNHAAYINTGINNIDEFGNRFIKNSNLGSEIVNTLSSVSNGLIGAMGGQGNFDLKSMVNGNFLTPADLIKVFQATNINVQIPRLHTIVMHRTGSNCMDYLLHVANYTTGNVSSIGGVLGYQEAPNSYEPELQVLNRTAISAQGMKGTYNLRWGYLTLHSVLVNSVNWKQSKFQAMDANGSSTGDPLYIEFEFGVELSTTILKDDLLQLITLMKS